MAMGQRKQERQSEFRVATQNTPRSSGHPSYEQFNQVFGAAPRDRSVQRADRLREKRTE